jgi:DNA-binding NtrC family response regulator
VASARPYTDGETEATDGPKPLGLVQRFHLEVREGPARGARCTSTGDRCSIGSHPSNDLVIEDATVSRFHCEIRIEPRGALVRDLGSTNGTLLDGTQVLEGFPRDGSHLRLGNTVVGFGLDAEDNQLPLTEATAFGSLVGTSVAMRRAFALLERVAASDATVLLEGETGTGKEGAAAAIHASSARAAGPFVVLDCGAIPPNLLESELFGHERGAFTGANARRVGLFEEADGGTILLDEVGELPLDLQPKLLRAIEQRQLRRVGSSGYLPVDVRVVAATHRDLRGEVNVGRFRADLYFRLAVVKVALPPLRSRPEDLPLLVERILETFGADPTMRKALTAPDFLASLARTTWPGNVRELRNYLERCLVFQAPVPLHDGRPPGAPAEPKYDEARRLALAEFERRYVEELLARHGGKVAEAAEAAGIDRASLYRIMRRHRLSG